jgi:hypothetical protein
MLVRSGGGRVALDNKKFASDRVEMQLPVFFINAFMGFMLDSKP